MDSPPEDAARPQRVALYSAISQALFNFIWWMILLAAIGFGALHLGSCPVEPLIPVYMMVLGSVTLMSLTLVYTNSIWGDGAVFKAAASCVSLLYLFDLCWFIAGSVWVYSVYPPDNSPDSTNYCSRPFYLFAFIVTTVIWVSASLIFVCGGCFFLCTCFTAVGAGRSLLSQRFTFYGATSDYQPISGDV